MSKDQEIKELHQKIASIVDRNEKMMRDIKLQNQELAALLPKIERNKKVVIFNPKTKREEPVKAKWG